MIMKNKWLTNFVVSFFAYKQWAYEFYESNRIEVGWCCANLCFIMFEWFEEHLCFFLSWEDSEEVDYLAVNNFWFFSYDVFLAWVHWVVKDVEVSVKRLISKVLELHELSQVPGNSNAQRVVDEAVQL